MAFILMDQLVVRVGILLMAVHFGTGLLSARVLSKLLMDRIDVLAKGMFICSDQLTVRPTAPQFFQTFVIRIHVSIETTFCEKRLVTLLAAEFVPLVGIHVDPKM